MSLKFVPTRSTVLGLVAAGLLSATALTASMALSPPTEVRADVAHAIDPTKGFAELVDRVMPAVVSVEVKFQDVAETTPDEDPRGVPPGFRDFFEQLPQFRGQPFGDGPQPHRGMAQGSGFIISSDGYAVTNNHVVKDADEVSVKMQDGTEYKAKVIGTDSKTDLALIKIDADKPLQTVSFAKSQARVGDWVVAVGNPFGLGGTVTTGIVSALGRDIGSGPYDSFMQIDASINRGNSGGPAFNLEGEVVGVNTAIFSPSGGSVGIGFAIPAAITQDVIDSLKTNGAVTRGWFGVQIQPVTKDIAESMGLSDAKGAIVADVTEKSPASDAGLKTGDTIVKVDGQAIADARELSRKVASLKPGNTVDAEIIRDGKPMTVAIKIGVMPNDPKMAMANPGADEKAPATALGLTLAPAPDGAGVQVMDVKPGSPADDRGLKAGDIIVEAAGQEVHSPADVKDAIGKSGKKRVLMLVKSGESQRFVTLPLDRG